MDRYRELTLDLPDRSGGSRRGGRWESDGPPVLCIQGLTSNHRCWGLLANAAPDLHLISIDARGRASGFGTPSPGGFARHADDLALLLDQQGIDRVVVAGHSMGGFVGLRFAQRHPDRLAGLVLLDGGPPVKLPGPIGSPRAVRFVFGRQLPKPRTYADVDEYFRVLGARAGSYMDLDPAFVRWAFGVDLAGPQGAMVVQQDRAMLLDDAVECFTGGWQGDALRSVSAPLRIVLAQWGPKHGKKPLYRADPDPALLPPGTVVERVAGIDHAEVLWDPATIKAIHDLL